MPALDTARPTPARAPPEEAPLDVQALPGLSISERREALAALGDDAQRALAEAEPELIGPLDGAPVEMRYVANRALVQRRVDALTEERARGMARVEAVAAALGGLSWLPEAEPEALADAVFEDLDAEIERNEALLGAQLLVYSPEGDGLIVEVHGDLEAAERLAVVLPGIGNDAAGYGGWSRTAATLLLEEASALTDEDVATISFLYDTPAGIEVGLDWGLELLKLGAGQGDAEAVREGLSNLRDVATQATTRALAEVAAGDLSRLVEGLGLSEDTHLTAVGHSYGSLVVGQAMAHHGLSPDDAVFLGSPGLGVSGRDALLRRRDADPSNDLDTELWAARAPLDLVSAGTDLFPLYGPDPSGFADHDMGTGDLTGHSGYMDRGTESLRNVARVVAGREDEVTRQPLPPWARDLGVGARELVNLLSTPFGGGWGDRGAEALGQARDALGEGLGWLAERGGEAVDTLERGFGQAVEAGAGFLERLRFWR